ncbi:MAG: GNAT family N-acetyltransferase [Coriobacteriia bacterium]|nr:GNAT family N-acetyltransferase [Coriobacteriia bacterium]MBN2822324.1 GNAT family N-acetyltransferase [Coriobacteriia bacterium]
MPDVIIRPMTTADLPTVSALLNATLGAGFWDIDLNSPGSHQVAERDDTVVGVASAILASELAEAPSLHGPISHLRIVGVCADARGLGVATRLVETVNESCARLGAVSSAAFAWVYRNTGRCALAGVLLRSGYARERRIEGFYAGASGPPCPACHQTPCICAADLYVKRVL